MNHNLRKPRVLAVFLLTLVLFVIAAGQENKNRRGDGSGVPPEAAKGAASSKAETKPNDEQANPPSDSNKEAARKARQERRNRKP
ncbi:MAG: hypothetical protein AABN95_03435 [Acidobacteriota bacterium]